MTDDRAPTVPNMCWAPAPPPQHQEWSALASPGAALQQQHQLGCCPPAGALPEVGPSSSLPERPTPSAPTQRPAKNILALVTAADHSSAPVLEFRLQTDDDALLACHRVQAFVFNQARHCPASPASLRSAFHRILMHGACLVQAVSSQQHLYADSSMCGGRAHLFDLEVLNLTYYGSSVWTVSVVGNLPSGRVSMALLDSLGNCERCDASNVASSRPNANPLGTITVEAAVANGALAWSRLRWQLTAEEVKPVLVKPIAHPAAKPAGKLEAPELASSGSSASSGSFKPTLGLNVGGSKLIPIGPAKARKGGPNREPRTKASRRLKVTLQFLSDHCSSYNASRSRHPKPAASFKARPGGFTSRASGASSTRSSFSSSAVQMESISGSDETELEELSRSDSVMELLLMNGELETDQTLDRGPARRHNDHDRPNLKLPLNGTFIAKTLAEFAESAARARRGRRLAAVAFAQRACLRARAHFYDTPCSCCAR